MTRQTVLNETPVGMLDIQSGCSENLSEVSVDDVADVGPPLSPSGTSEITRGLSPTVEDSDTDVVDREDIKSSFREVDNDLDDSNFLHSESDTVNH